MEVEFKARVRELAERRDAVILAHNYQRPEIQEVADHVGDSLALARLAAASTAKVIVLAGVYFIYSATVEERYLAEQFPDSYPAYRRSTKMLVPFVF